MTAQAVKGKLGVARFVNVNTKRSGITRKKRVRTAASRPRSRAKPVKADVPANVSSSSDDQDLPDQSWQQVTDQSAELEDSLSSPEVALHGNVSVSFKEYKSRLLADPARRCVKIAGNDRKAVCVAIATGKETPSGLVVQNNCLEHVLCVPMAFQGDDAGVSKHIAFICTCKQMASRVASINSRSASKMSYTEFIQHTQPCWHASAAKDLLTEDNIWLEPLSDTDLYDRVSDVKLTQSSMTIIRCDSHDVAGLALSVALHANGFPRCIVGADTDGTLCCRHSQCCSKNRKHSCEHCRLVADQLQRVESQLDNEDVTSADVEEATAMLAELQGLHLQLRSKAQSAFGSASASASLYDTRLPISKGKIPADLKSTVMQERASGKLGGLLPRCQQCLATSSACSHCIPCMPADPSAVCPECSAPWDDSDPVAKGWVTQASAVLVARETSQSVTVFHRKCSDRHCSGIMEYQGQEDCVFNWSNHYLITYGVGFSYADDMCDGKLPYSQHFKSLRNAHEHTGTAALLMSRPIHRVICQAFLASLDLDYKDIFTCPRCTADNMTVIIDGKEMGIRHTMSKPYERPIDLTAPRVPVECPHSRLVSVNHQGIRTLLVELCRQGLAEQDFRRLLEFCQDAAPQLGSWLQNICTAEEFEQEVNCPPVYRRLLEAIGTNYPTAAFLGPGYAPHLTALIEQQLHIGPSEAEEMHCGFPLLHALVQECSWDSIPSDLAPMLEHLVSCACAPNSTTSIPETCLPEGYKDTHSFFPALPVIRCLPQFKADKQTSSDGPACPKYARAHPLLSPGTFTCFCAHATCLGFSLMASHEGPRTPFELLYTRFRTAPKMVVYDNACNLQRYVLKRTPHYFRHTSFRIDRLHVFAHHGCSSGCNLDEYPAQMPIAEGVNVCSLNTQVAEQVNSLLESIRTQVAYMTHDNAMAYIRYFLAKYNMRLKRKWSKSA